MKRIRYRSPLISALNPYNSFWIIEMRRKKNEHYVAKDLLGKRMVITAGGNREPIDPIRFIGIRIVIKRGANTFSSSQLFPIKINYPTYRDHT